MNAPPGGGVTYHIRHSPVLAIDTDMEAVTGLSFEWADGDFTSLLVRWDPVTAPPGGGVTYHIRYSPVLAIDMITCVGEASTSEAVDTSILPTGLDPRVFYSVMVDAIIQDALPTTGSGKIVYMCILFSSMHLSCRS